MQQSLQWLEGLRTCSSWRSRRCPAASSTAPSNDDTAVTGPRNSLHGERTYLHYNCEQAMNLACVTNLVAVPPNDETAMTGARDSLGVQLTAVSIFQRHASSFAADTRSEASSMASLHAWAA
jgi:hypothetical protein